MSFPSQNELTWDVLFLLRAELFWVNIGKQWILTEIYKQEVEALFLKAIKRWTTSEEVCCA